ncbi:MAG TPA: carboxymuconolactone decarboxylase family protein [Bacillota bacterium]|nr:carboxymuconolactone decarboxylase family protein [Bacillota bacterium]
MMHNGRELYSLKEIYRIVYDGSRTAPYIGKAKRTKELDPGFIERIMLAVTEVNGCAICSYAHTKMALEAGMSNEEIQKMLAGVMSDLTEREAPAIFFAQHYADSRGKPSKEAWEHIIDNYGPSVSRGILGAIRVIMMGNAYGIPWSSFVNRFKGKPDERSSLFYEIEVILGGSVLLPVAILHAWIALLMKKELITF